MDAIQAATAAQNKFAVNRATAAADHAAFAAMAMVAAAAKMAAEAAEAYAAAAKISAAAAVDAAAAWPLATAYGENADPTATVVWTYVHTAGDHARAADDAAVSAAEISGRIGVEVTSFAMDCMADAVGAVMACMRDAKDAAFAASAAAAKVAKIANN